MRRFVLAIFFSGLSFNVYAASKAEMIAKSMVGDYQSQRNLAYSYTDGWGKLGSSDYVEKDPVKACAWYKTILATQKNKITDGDIGNESVYCHLLRLDQLVIAFKESKKQMAKIKHN